MSSPPRARKHGAAKVDRALEKSRDDNVPRDIDGDSQGDLTARVTEALAPDVIAIGLELRDENVLVACARQRAAAKIDSAVEISGDDGVSRGIRSHGITGLIAHIPEALAPDTVATGTELRDEDIRKACARKHTTAKINGAIEISRDDHVSRGVDGDGSSELIARIAEAPAPDMIAAGTELRDKDVIAARARKRTSAEVDGAKEESRDDHIPRGVDGDVVGVLRVAIAETLAPDVSAIGPELRDEDVVAARARKRASAKVDSTIENSRDDHVSRGVRGDTLGILTARVAEALAPEVLHHGRGRRAVFGFSTFLAAPDRKTCTEYK